MLCAPFHTYTYTPPSSSSPPRAPALAGAGRCDTSGAEKGLIAAASGKILPLLAPRPAAAAVVVFVTRSGDASVQSLALGAPLADTSDSRHVHGTETPAWTAFATITASSAAAAAATACASFAAATATTALAFAITAAAAAALALAAAGDGVDRRLRETDRVARDSACGRAAAAAAAVAAAGGNGDSKLLPRLLLAFGVREGGVGNPNPPVRICLVEEHEGAKPPRTLDGITPMLAVAFALPPPPAVAGMTRR